MPRCRRHRPADEPDHSESRAPAKQTPRRRPRTLGRELRVLDAGDPSEIDAAFATWRQRPVGALLVSSDPFFSSRRRTDYRARGEATPIPAMYSKPRICRGWRADELWQQHTADAYRRAGVYVGRILNGAKPADLPVDQATKFEFVINLKTAKTLGIAVPPDALASADEVIE